MQTKVLLIDVDGVIIKSRGKYFSEIYAEEYGIELSLVSEFFRNEYRLAATGKATIKEVLSPYLKKWRWNKSIEEFLTYWFEEESNLDQEVLSALTKIRKDGVKIYLASDNEAERAKYIQEQLGVGAYVDGSFFSASVGFRKSEPLFFKAVLDELKVAPSEVEYWDDDPQNLAVAANLGILGKHFVSISELNSDLLNH